MITAIHGILEQGGVPGPLMWYDAAIGVTKDGSDKVSAWADKSGSNLTLTQSNTTYQPTYVASSIGGLPAIRFNGHQLSTISQTIGNREYVAVFKLNGAYTGAYHTLMIQDGTPFYQVYIDNTRIRGFIDPSVYDSLFPTPANGASNLLFTKLSTNTGISFRLNGSNGASISPPTKPAATGPFKLGSYGVNTNPMNGEIAEIMVYNRSLTTAERTSIENYLKAKYGFTF